ncbi:glycosyltransferase family 4 protein [Occallatibacter riparius]|uniref:Glycosyltransferase family 4 protein n=1 Tax=Occallatibacter riparius TaxID=1002689 RepID=A0A9J7BUX0_9BACT|nr:glycosyltransferase family 1 protein [Occallatibacter riparius]UWZ85562.1 glycosyltransferase family 4 protein [Occallatibacter riparius]
MHEGDAQRAAFPFRVAYDARLSLGKFRGMGRFLRQLIAGREREFLGFCAPGDRDDGLNLASLGPRPYPAWEQIAVPRLLRQNDIDVFIAPYNTSPLSIPDKTQLILVVHDLIFMEALPWSRSAYQNLGRIYRRLVAPHAVKRADLVVTVSEFTARQLVEKFAVQPNRLRVIPNTISAEWYATDRTEQMESRYILVVAGEAPSKNLGRALIAFAACSGLRIDQRIRMKIAGVSQTGQAAFRAQARQLGISDRVDFLPYLTEDGMRETYRQSEILLMPSLCEGFGIPVLEAMASGTPVVCSSSTCLPEIGADAPRYFNPYSTSSMAEAIQQVLSNAQIREEMSQRGLKRAHAFHPDIVHQRIHSFWEEVRNLQENRRA